MSRTKMILAAAVGAGAMLASSSARASIAFVGFQRVPISATALAADPALANYSSFDLMISISPGDHWAATGLQGTLAFGNFYVPATFDADTGLQSIAAFVPNLTYDTFVSRPGYNDPGSGAILGSASGVPAFTMPKASNDKRTIDVAWGDVNALQNNLIGVQPIARLTSVGPFLYFDGSGVLKGTLDPSANYRFSFSSDPEPTSVALAAAGVGLTALRRRPRRQRDG